MTYTRKQVVTSTSIVYLVLVTALAGYAASRASNLYIPISTTLAGFTTALPIISGLLLEGGYDFTRVQERREHVSKGSITRPPLVIAANTLIFIYSTVLMTLLGTHAAPPSGLSCSLQDRWKTLFSRKHSEAIRVIQEALNCCGFMNTHDMAWPFPDKNHDVHACERAFQRNSGCFGPWRGEEQHMAGILMAVVGLVFLWQITIIAIPTRRESWLHRVVPDRVSRIIADEEHGSDRPRRAIEYLPNFSHYRDNVAEGTSDAEDSTAQRVGGGVEQVRKALTSGSNDEEQREQHPTVENEWARN